MSSPPIAQDSPVKHEFLKPNDPLQAGKEWRYEVQRSKREVLRTRLKEGQKAISEPDITPEVERNRAIFSFEMWKRECARDDEPVSRISWISYGRTEYLFQRTVDCQYANKNERFTFYIEQLLPHFVVEAPTKYAAYERFCEQIHVTTQRLRSFPESNRTDAEREQWKLLRALIDFEAYEQSLPTKAIQMGVVTSAWPNAWKVRWTDGREEAVRLRDMPANFALFHEGDRLEATVDRHPITEKLIYVHGVRPVDPTNVNVQTEIEGVSDRGAAVKADKWTKRKNHRRCELIDKEIAGVISDKQGRELAELQEQLRRHLDEVAPLPIEGARRLHDELEKKKREREAKG